MHLRDLQLEIGQRRMSGLARSCLVASLGLSVAGFLLILEVVRPFHDLANDGPLALMLWGLGATISLWTFFLRGRSVVFSAIGLSVNLVPLLGAGILWWLLSHSNFAWH